MTYGDGVSDVDVRKLIAFHCAHGRVATVTAVQPPGRFGSLELSGDLVARFDEKPTGDGRWINGGFFVLEPKVFDYLRDGDNTIWEHQPLSSLSEDGQLVAYRHQGFWEAMDTLRDKNHLENLWTLNQAPWKIW
jgi:glucose-1-phosphate cytidylyltransferase